MRIKVEKLINEGWGLGHDSDKPIFVKKSVPGDILDVEIYKEKSKYNICNIKSIIVPSPDRIEPFCTHFHQCGSCEFQCISYENQLKYKAEIFKELLDRAKIATEIMPIITGSEPKYYRGNMRYGFLLDKDNKIHISMHDYVANKPFPIQNCYLQSELSIQIATEIADFINDNIKEKATFWQLKIRDGKFTDEVMVEIITTGESLPGKTGIVDLLKKHPEVKSIYHTVSPAKSLNSMHRYLLYGSPIIHEKVGKYTFQISPDSFFQTNSLGVKTLYDKIKEFANIEMGDIVLDLYCGTGTIGIYLSTLAKKVIGVESVQSAVNDASANAKINHIRNTEFVCADAAKWLHDSCSMFHDPCIILDPPRAGLSKNLLYKLSTLNLKNLVYVSCNPATFARDIVEFDKLGLKLKKVQPIDMFPQTHHIECVGILSK